MRVFEDESTLGRYLANKILDEIVDASLENRSYVLGCPGGRSLRPTYLALGAAARARDNLDLSPLVIAMMDEYVLPSRTGYDNVSVAAHFSCTRFAFEEIVQPLLGVRGAPGQDRVWVPNPDDPSKYDKRLASAGGIDRFLLASGVSDGHVAFNPPGSDRESITRVVQLAATTRSDNLDTFPQFEGLSEVPLHGVTVGLGSISDLSRSATLVCTGSHKAATVRRVRTSDGFDPAWPATIIHECRGAEFLVDRAAAGSIDTGSIEA